MTAPPKEKPPACDQGDDKKNEHRQFPPLRSKKQDPTLSRFFSMMGAWLAELRREAKR